MLQRYNSTPDLLDDSSRRSFDLSPEVTSSSDGLRSLRDVIVTTKHDARTTNATSVTARTGLGGSTGNILYDVPRRQPPGPSTSGRPPPPVRGLSTFTNTDTPPPHHGQHQATGSDVSSALYAIGVASYGALGHVPPLDFQLVILREQEQILR